MAKPIKAILLLLALALLASVPSAVSAVGPDRCFVETGRYDEEGEAITRNTPGLVRDCEALLAARGALGATIPLNWSAKTSMDYWTLVEINYPDEDHVEQLLLNPTLRNSQGEYMFRGILTGRIPASLGRLANLKYLMLGNNQLTGRIPASLGNLSQLRGLDLGDNQLSGEIPTELGNLSNLDWLGLSNNQLRGEIPTELGNLTNLEQLYLRENELTGPIPASLGNLTNLEGLWLHENQLTGEIPTQLGNLANLEQLNLHENELTGPIPGSLGNLTNLEGLWLHENQLTGEIPTQLGNLANLAHLNLRENQLSGEIPAELGNLSNLESLHLGGNQLTGCIPEELRDVPENDLEELSLFYCAEVILRAPTGLTAEADGKTQIDLSWSAPKKGDRSPSITGYRIEVSGDGTAWRNLVANTRSKRTSYSHAGLTAGTTRHYRVSAIYWVGGAGPASKVATATTPSAPGAPTGLTAEADGRRKIDMSWMVPEDDGGAAITGYRIEVSGDGADWGELKADTRSKRTSYSHAGLTAGTTRHYRVTAINSVGTGPASNVATATTDSAPPGAPRDLTAKADGQNEIDLSWSVPEDDGGEAITGYRIEVLGGGTAWNDLVTDTGSTSTRYSHTGLSAGSARHYRVSAINSVGTGPASNDATAATDSAPPEAPRDLTATADGEREIDLSWSAPEDDGGEAITGYRIEVSRGGTAWSDLEADTGSTSTSYSHTGLTAGSARHYRVSAINSVGTSPASNVATSSYPGVPTGLTAEADGQTQIDLSWNAPASDGGSAITGYRIEVSGDGTAWSDLEADTGSTSTSYSHTGLTAGSARHYRVSAINSAGTGLASNVTRATTASATATGGRDSGLATVPEAPTGLRARANGQTQINLSWSAPAKDGGEPITGYRIEVSEDESIWSNLAANTQSTSTSYSHTGLTAASTRLYRVSAVNSVGGGPASNVATATTALAGEPGGGCALTEGPVATESAAGNLLLLMAPLAMVWGLKWRTGRKRTGKRWWHSATPRLTRTGNARLDQ